MPRKPRIWYPGAIYHVTARGNRKMDLFLDPLDYQTYLKYLSGIRIRSPFVLHSYCLMTNHLHLQLETIDTPIQTIIKDLHSQYAIYFNCRHETVGHVFQGRYGAELIENYPYFLKVSSYIHLNPVEAKVVERPEHYRWSSYAAYLSPRSNPYVSKEKTLSYFSSPYSANPKRPARLQYKEMIEGIMGGTSLVKS